MVKAGNKHTEYPAFVQHFSPADVITLMNVTLKTPVSGNYRAIMDRFDRELFEFLTPKGADVTIVEFTGSKTGDRVHLRFNKPIRADWVSAITDHGHNEREAWFVDEGTQLPWPLGYWHHKHIVRKVSETESLIIDDMTFRGRNGLLSLILYPAIYFGFLPRKKLYKKYFSR